MFGHGGHHVQVIDLTGETLYVEADRLLAFDGTLQQGTMFMGSQGGVMGMVRGQVTGQGLFTTTLKGHGSAAVMAHGGVIELPITPQRPVHVDPQAYVAHRGDVRNKLSTALGWRDMVGRGSGEALPAGAVGPGHRLRTGLGGEAVTGPVVHDVSPTLPADDNVNPYTFSVELNGQWFLQKGKMIAYYGRIDFNGIGHGRLDRLVAGQSSIRRCTPRDWVVAEGQGKMLLADRAFDVNSYDLDKGNLTIRSGNLLAFQPSLALKQSIVPGFLTLIGTGKFVAASNGPVVFIEPPIRVDPQALVGWADCPSPCHHYDHQYLRAIPGRAACAHRDRRGLRRGAPVRVRRGRHGPAAVDGAADGRSWRPARCRSEAGVPGWGGPAPQSGSATAAAAGQPRGPPAPLRAVSGSLRTVTSNV